MRYSIIIPVYNVSKYLPRCLDSAIAQAGDDYEIITVDDGSTDESGMILKEYMSSHNNIKVISQSNKGLGGARNTGIKEASGDYVIFLDSDDYISMSMLRTITYYLSSNEIDLLAFDCYHVNNSGQILQKVTDGSYTDYCTPLTHKQLMLLEPSACLKVFRRRLFIDNHVFFPEHLWYEDLATYYRLIPFIQQAAYLKAPLYYYVQQGDSITHSKDTTRMNEIIIACDGIRDFYINQSLFQEYSQEIEWLYFKHMIYYSAFRLFSAAYKPNQMRKLYRHFESIFPNYRSNQYLQKNINKLWHMNLILNRRFFLFYLKNNIIPKVITMIKRKNK